MAVLRQGSVITATVDQSLGNCLLVHFKHRSRTFRGILFDEKNSVVPRASISKQSDDEKLMCNKSSLPLGMAVVSPSKQPYSSLRNRIYYNTTPKRSGGSSSRSSVSKSSDAKSNSQAGSELTGKDNINSKESSAQTHIKIGKDGLSELDSKHSSRLLRHQCKNTINIGNSLKRKAESDLAGAKPLKSRSNGASQNSTTNTSNLNSSKNDSTTYKKPSSRESSRGKVIELGMDSNNKTQGTENVVENHPCDQTETAESTENNMNTTCSLTSVRQNIFPPEQDFKTTNIFSNEQSEIQDLQSECVDSGSDGAVEFFGRLGLGSACSDRDDGSVYTDSGASCSSNEQLGERTDLLGEEKTCLKNESELLGAQNNEYKKESYSKQSSLTPTKKSARISAKRAILEQNIETYNDNTIWSIWGGVPSQKQKDRECSSPDSHVMVDSPESLTEVVEVCHSDLIAENKSLFSSSRAKGARIKQTPIRSKNTHSNMCVPEKQVSVGNIVWGKVHGHPWWPGRVLAVSGNFGEGSETTKHAHVTWFGSNTSSIMPVNELQHFAANFSRRHKKAKRGCYRKAVKQAQDMLLIMGEES